MMNSFKVYTTMPILVVVLFVLNTSVRVTGTTFTFVNRCDYTVWPGILAGASSPKLDSTGFELTKGGTRTFNAPSGWSGRFWGRTGCNFNGAGQGTCATGDCGSNSVECNGSGATPPATLAEFTLNGSEGQDFYDVSLVDGYNLPMIVVASGGSGACTTTGCLVDLNQRCPNELMAKGGGACEAFGTPEYCCSGEFGTPDKCKPSQYSQLFKTACPRSYSYAYDDASSTFTCTGGDYTITFCPSSPSQKSSMDTSTGNVGATAEPGTSGSGSSSDTSTGTGTGTGSLMADGSWFANLASSSNTRQPSFTLHLTLLFVVATSLATSLYSL